jgi:hypothetical protein
LLEVEGQASAQQVVVVGEQDVSSHVASSEHATPGPIQM